MADYSDKQTDKQLAALEKKIHKVYKEAQDDVQGKINEYFANFRERDKKQQELLEKGEIDQQQYTQWRLNQIGRGKRYIAMRDELAQRMTQANETAVAYINDATPGIYSLNRNYAAYTIEAAGADVSFTLMDEQTVKRLIEENPELMPYYPPSRAVKRGIDLEYGKKKITACVTSGIIQGESLGKIADRLQSSITDMNRTSALRTARTAVTGAQNAGRMDSYKAAEDMGITLKKQWVATLDGRTRDSHRWLDSKIVDIDKDFPNGCSYPGDPSGPASEVYNCRCTMIAVVDGVDTSDAQRRAKDPSTGETELVSNMSYQQWEGWKEETQKTVANDIDDGIIVSDGLLKSIGIQFFANSDIQKWKTTSIEKAISKWGTRIEEHEDKIANPEKYDREWKSKIQAARDGEILHWRKEIRNFKDLIQQAESELEKRRKEDG